MVWLLSKGNWHAVMSPFPRSILLFNALLPLPPACGATCLQFTGRWNQKPCLHSKGLWTIWGQRLLLLLRRGRGQCVAYINSQHNFRVPLLWCKTKQKTKKTLLYRQGSPGALPWPSRGKEGPRGTGVVIALSNTTLFLTQKPHFCFQNNTQI